MFSLKNLRLFNSNTPNIHINYTNNIVKKVTIGNKNDKIFKI